MVTIYGTLLGSSFTGSRSLLSLYLNGVKAGAALALSILNAGGTFDVNGFGALLQGLNFQPRITNTGSSATIPSLTAILSNPSMSGLAGSTITNLIGLQCTFNMAGNNGVAITNMWYLRLVAPGSPGTATFGTVYGLDVPVFPAAATTKIGIREQSGGVNLISGKTRIGDQTTPTDSFEVSGNQTITGVIDKYNGVTTTAFGVPAVVAGGTVINISTAATTTLATYTVGASDGTFKIGAYIDAITVFNTTPTLNVQVTYTDENNSARTLTWGFLTEAGVFTSGGVTAIAAGAHWTYPTLTIRVKTATAITIKCVTAGSTGTENVNGVGTIEQVA